MTILLTIADFLLLSDDTDQYLFETGLFFSTTDSSRSWVYFFFCVILMIPDISLFFAFYFVVRRTYKITLTAKNRRKSSKRLSNGATNIITNEDIFQSKRATKVSTKNIIAENKEIKDQSENQPRKLSDFLNDA